MPLESKRNARILVSWWCCRLWIVALVSIVVGPEVATGEPSGASDGAAYGRSPAADPLRPDVALGYRPENRRGRRSGGFLAGAPGLRRAGPDDEVAVATIRLPPVERSGYRLQPSVGGFLSPVHNDPGATGILGPDLGLRLHVTKSVVVGVDYSYQWSFARLGPKGVADDLAHGTHTAGFSVTVLLGR